MAATHFSGPIVVGGVEVISAAGAVTADIQATAGSIGAAELATDAVETLKIKDLNVTTAKLAANGVTMPKLVRGTNGQIIVANTGADSAYVTMSGDATLAANGALTIAAGAVESSMMAAGNLQYAEVSLSATEIVGNAAGALGHANGAVLVAAQADKILELVSAVLILDYSTAAYTGGGADLVIRQGSTALTAAIAVADLVGAGEDKIVLVNPTVADDIPLTANSTINLYAGTPFTQPGTAAGALRVKVTYRVHTAGLA